MNTTEAQSIRRDIDRLTDKIDGNGDGLTHRVVRLETVVTQLKELPKEVRDLQRFMFKATGALVVIAALAPFVADWVFNSWR